MIVKVNTNKKEFPPTPQLLLTEKEGNFINGVLKRKLKDSTYPKKENYFITVTDLEGATIIWDKETKSERPQNANVGEDVFVRGFTTLKDALVGVPEGTYVEIKYVGKGEAKKGQKPPFLVEVGVER